MFVSNVLFRAAFLGFLFLCIGSVPVLLLTDQIHLLHNSMIEIPRAEYNALLFNWLGNLKLIVFAGFLIPAIAIRWTLRKTAA